MPDLHARVKREASRDKLVRVLSRQVAIWTSVTFLYWAFDLTIGQGVAIGWALGLMTADWGPRDD
jgi:hypothetical protein